MPVSVDELSKNAMGGTERMKWSLAEKLNRDVLDRFQIICSRVREIDNSLIPIYWLHDLPGDPESEHLKQGGYNKFESLVFVSNWQMQNYINHYKIPWYKCTVLKNAIDPFPEVKKEKDKIRIIYHTTPHRGLNILVSAFMKLCETQDDVVLDVYSSFDIYGWPERNKPYEELFDICRNHPQINYHGYQPNEVVREALTKAHIFAYPSIWQETSCIALLEAMSAGCICLHPNYGALYETAANNTIMYQWHEDPRNHLQRFYSYLHTLVQHVFDEKIQESALNAKYFIDSHYNWDRRIQEWEDHLKTILIRKNISV